MFKKVISLLIVFTIVLSIWINTTAYGQANDYEGHWAGDTIQLWIDKGNITGYPDGSFKPDGKITRAEFVTMVNNLFGYTEKSNINYNDVTSNDWYFEEVQKAFSAGYILGVSETQFSPSDNITREQAAVIVSRIMNLEGNQEAASIFTDSNKISIWALDLVGAAAKSEIVKGYSEDSTFRPQNFITRAEAVVTLERTQLSQDLVIDKPGTIVENSTYRNVHITKEVGNGEVTFKNVTITGELLVEGGGQNSIIIENSSINKLTINKADGKVRILLNGETVVDLTSILSGVTLEQEDLIGDGFRDVAIDEKANTSQTITINADIKELSFKAKITVNVNTGIIESIIVDEAAEGLKIDLGQDVKVISAVINTSVSFTGNGIIEKAEVNSDDVTFEKEPLEIVVAAPSIGGGGGGSVPPTAPETELNRISNSLEVIFDVK